MRAAPLALLAAALATAAPLALAPAAARADDASAAEPPRIAVRLNYTRSPSAMKVCPPEQALHDEVARRLGYDPFTLDAPDRVVATLNRDGNIYSGTLDYLDETGKRKRSWEQRQEYAYRGEHKDDDCSTLILAMAVDLAVAFIPWTLPPRPPPATPSPPPPPEAPPAASAPTPPPAAPAPPRSIAQSSTPAPPPPKPLIRPRVEVGLGPVLGFGIAPSTAFGGVLHLGLRGPWWSLAIEGRSDLPASGRSTALPRDYTTALLGGSIVACGHYTFLLGCGIVTGGRVRAETMGVGSPNEINLKYLGIGVRLGVEFSLAALWKPLAVRFNLDGLGSVLTPRLTADPRDSPSTGQPAVSGAEVWRMRRMSENVGVALVTSF